MVQEMYGTELETLLVTTKLEMAIRNGDGGGVDSLNQKSSYDPYLIFFLLFPTYGCG